MFKNKSLHLVTFGWIFLCIIIMIISSWLAVHALVVIFQVHNDRITAIKGIMSPSDISTIEAGRRMAIFRAETYGAASLFLFAMGVIILINRKRLA